MKKIFIASVVWTLTALSVQTNLPTYTLEGSLAQEVPFIAHTSREHLGRYLARNVVFYPIERFMSDIDWMYFMNVKSRGEAHITVIDPLEYERLHSKIDIAEINQIFGPSIQNTHFTVECLGEGKKEINGRLEYTFFLVVSSPELLQIRQKISNIFLERGGDPKDFDPKLYFLHIIANIVVAN